LKTLFIQHARHCGSNHSTIDAPKIPSQRNGPLLLYTYVLGRYRCKKPKNSSFAKIVFIPKPSSTASVVYDLGFSFFSDHKLLQ
jgi:hypothetical protein